jgi:hypothetical protein
MQLVIETANHGLIVSDSIDKTKEECADIIINILNNNGCFKLYVKGKLKVIPHGVLNTSLIEFVN